jgi:hypothetical protein
MSQSDEILAYLQQGKTLTPLEGLHLFGTLRLGARCFDLRKAGHDVRANKVERNGKWVAEYYLYREQKEFDIEITPQI